MRLGSTGFVQPFRYTLLLWATGLGWLIFGEVPDALAGHSATKGQGHRSGKTVISFAVRSDRMERG